MASITITLTNTCSGGNHVVLSVTGEKSATIRSEIDQLLDPITEDDALAFVRVLVKLAKVGRTKVQLKNLLESGLTVSV